MKQLQLIVAVFGVFVALPRSARADLPVHCIRNWVLGDWELTFSKFQDAANRKCGYPEPDTNRHHFDHPEAYQFTPDKKIKIRLKAPNVVECIEGCGGPEDAAAVAAAVSSSSSSSSSSSQTRQQHHSEQHESMKEDVPLSEIHDDELDPSMFSFQEQQQTDDSAYTAETEGYMKPLDQQQDDQEIIYTDQADNSEFPRFRGVRRSGYLRSNFTALFEDDETAESDSNTQNSVIFQQNSGVFTMVYDEGFEINIGARSMFAFFDYQPKEGFDYHTGDDVNDYKTDCGSVRTGWSHVRHDGGEAQDWACFAGKRIGGEAPQHDFHTERQEAIVSPTSFIVQAEKIDPDSRFSHNTTFIHHHNSNPTRTWTAKAYPRFQNKSVSEMMQLLGSSGREVFRVRHPKRFMTPRHLEQSVSHLPRDFDWRSQGIVTPVKNQGACGSCYAVASMDSASMRYMIQTGKKDASFSMDDVLNHSFYNQGCAGGYPFLVGKHGKDLGFIQTGCEHGGQGCQRTYIKDYKYLGGFYGACNEALMMKEIAQNGPIVAAFNAPSNLFSYHHGIFEGGKLQKNDNWEKTNHAIVVVGWGENDQGKYWIVKNSWGEFWGENGYFKMKRGTDDCAFESMGVAIELGPVS